jgi:hypothetical protein
VCLDNLLLLEFAWDDLFDLVLETERNLGDFFWLDGRGRESFCAAGCRKHWMR